MGDSSSKNSHSSRNSNNLVNKGLLGSGWQPVYQQFDVDYFLHLLSNDTWKLFQKTLDLTSDIAYVLGYKNNTWWANILGIFSEGTQDEINEFWDYITPQPIYPDNRYREVLTVETPREKILGRETIPINYAMQCLEEISLFKTLDLLGSPDIITQYFADRNYHYPIQQFTTWERLEVLGTVYAFWSQEEGVWLEIYLYDGKRCYTLSAKNIQSLINKATYNLSVLVSGYQTRVGKVHSNYPIRSFPSEIQSFTDIVQQIIFEQNRLAVLVHGKPGTGKTAWTQAIAQEVLVPLGYVVFILDHNAVENFIPPSYLERICLIINEADNLAQDRSSLAAQNNTKTEHILSLLDGTLYQSVIDESGQHSQQRLVILMTCNTTERLDPAFLRKGRVDLIQEFTHQLI